MFQCICQSPPDSPAAGFLFLQTPAVGATHSAEWTVSQTDEPFCPAAALEELVPRPHQHHGIVETFCASLGIHFVASNINYQLKFHCPHDTSLTHVCIRLTAILQGAPSSS